MYKINWSYLLGFEISVSKCTFDSHTVEIWRLMFKDYLLLTQTNCFAVEANFGCIQEGTRVVNCDNDSRICRCRRLRLIWRNTRRIRRRGSHWRWISVHWRRISICCWWVNIRLRRVGTRYRRISRWKWWIGILRIACAVRWIWCRVRLTIRGRIFVFHVDLDVWTVSKVFLDRRKSFENRSRKSYFERVIRLACEFGSTGVINRSWRTEVELHYETLINECNQKLSQCPKERHTPPPRKRTRWRATFNNKNTAKICFKIKQMELNLRHFCWIIFVSKSVYGKK